jgi:hypothetical protein
MRAMVSSIARSSIPSRVQHGADPVPRHWRQRRSIAVNSRAAVKAGPVTAVATAGCGGSRDRCPTTLKSGHRALRCTAAMTIRPSTSRSAARPAARPAGTARPVSGAAAARRGLPRLGVGAHVKIPGAEFGQHRATSVSGLRGGVGLLQQLITAGGLERAPCLAAAGVVGQFEITCHPEQSPGEQDALHLDAARRHRRRLGVTPVVLDLGAVGGRSLSSWARWRSPSAPRRCPDPVVTAMR